MQGVGQKFRKNFPQPPDLPANLGAWLWAAPYLPRFSFACSTASRIRDSTSCQRPSLRRGKARNQTALDIATLCAEPMQLAAHCLSVVVVFDQVGVGFLLDVDGFLRQIAPDSIRNDAQLFLQFLDGAQLFGQLEDIDQGHRKVDRKGSKKDTEENHAQCVRQESDGPGDGRLDDAHDEDAGQSP